MVCVIREAAHCRIEQVRWMHRLVLVPSVEARLKLACIIEFLNESFLIAGIDACT